MNIFESKHAKKIDYLEEQYNKLFLRLEAIEKDINKRPSDLEKEARQASKKTAEYRNQMSSASSFALVVHTSLYRV